MATTERMVLEMDADDWRDIRRAIAMRERAMPMPDGTSNNDGAAVAEICRGYMEMLDAAGPETEGDEWKR